MARKTFGIVGLLMGISILAWVGYNYFIEMQPAAEGKSPIIAIVFSLVLIFLGIQRLRK